jgi:serine/threonine protein kinase
MLIVEGVRLQSVIPAHKHILQLLAATWDGTSPMLIYPYSAQGNFKQYLTKFASGGLSTHQIVRMGIHLLSAMGHLHKRGIIHRDIAARNCL